MARVAGPARAGGLGLIAAADLAVCAREATFAFTEVRIGVIPAVISATVLRRLHRRAAAELYLTGETFDGRRAAELGLVTAAVPAADLAAPYGATCDGAGAGRPGRPGRRQAAAAPPPRTALRADLAELAELSVELLPLRRGPRGRRRVPGEAATVLGTGQPEDRIARND